MVGAGAFRIEAPSKPTVTQMGIMGVIIGLVIGVIGLVIVTEIIDDANFTAYGTLIDTVTSNIPIVV